MRSRRYIGAFDSTDALPDVEEDAPIVVEIIAAGTTVPNVIIPEEPLLVSLSSTILAPAALSTVISGAYNG